MRKKYNFIYRLTAYLLLVSLFLQSCSTNSSNPTVPKNSMNSVQNSVQPTPSFSQTLNWSDLPEEVSIHILEFLSVQELQKCKSTSKFFYQQSRAVAASQGILSALYYHGCNLQKNLDPQVQKEGESFMQEAKRRGYRPPKKFIQGEEDTNNDALLKDDLLERAKQGDSEAQFELGKIAYETWKEQHTQEACHNAKKWLKKAATQGHTESTVYLKKLRRKIACEKLGFNKSLPIISKQEIEFSNNPSSILGQGGSGIVFKARYQGEQVAFKQLGSQSDQKVIEDFKKEAIIMFNLRHPNLVTFLGFCEEIPPALVMEYASESSLSNWLKTPASEDPTWENRYQIALDIAEGIKYLHKYGVLHRDLKGDNILIDADKRAKVTDFGISVLKGEHTNYEGQETNYGACENSGTWRWMAPELLKEDTVPSTKAADVYGYGMILWQLGTRNYPFANVAPGKVALHIVEGNREKISVDTPQRIRNVIELCWLQDPALINFQKRPTMRQICYLLDIKRPDLSDKKLEKRNSKILNLNQRINKLTEEGKEKQAIIVSNQKEELEKQKEQLQKGFEKSNREALEEQRQKLEKVIQNLNKELKQEKENLESEKAISEKQNKKLKKLKEQKQNLKNDSQRLSEELTREKENLKSEKANSEKQSQPLKELEGKKQELEKDIQNLNKELAQEKENLQSEKATSEKQLKWHKYGNILLAVTGLVLVLLVLFCPSLPLIKLFPSGPVESPPIPDPCYELATPQVSSYQCNNTNNIYYVNRDHREDIAWDDQPVNQTSISLPNNSDNTLHYSQETTTQNHEQNLAIYQEEAKKGNLTAKYHLGLAYENGWGVPKNVQESFRWYKKAAEEGNADAQNNLGNMYYNGYYDGERIIQDDKKAFECYKKAADQNHPIAKYNLGNLYYYGRGVTQCYEEAEKYYREAAENEVTAAKNNLGFMYQYGCGVDQNYTIAKNYYEEAVKGGDSFASRNLGDMYLNGWGVAKNNQKACEWYQKAIEKGNRDALYNLTALAEQDIIESKIALAYIYRNGIGIKKDDKLAVEWYRSAAQQKQPNDPNWVPLGMHNTEALEWCHLAGEQGDLKAQLHLGYAYNMGEASAKQNKPEAVKWYTLAAIQGDPGALNVLEKIANGENNGDAQYALGNIYYQGKGVPKDISTALEWYQKAAKQGNGYAQYALGNIYYQGEGVPKAILTAVEWYQKAAKQGNGYAQYALGNIYYQGEGVPKDILAAVEWYQKAAEQGNGHAQYILGMIYYRGEAGGTQESNAKEAMKWFLEASKLGDDKAQAKLGDIYYNGEGIAKDHQEAIQWYKKAAEQGNMHAQGALKALANERLLTAAREGNNEELLAALKDDANIEARDGFEDMPGYKGFTPLLVAAHWGKLEIVEVLLRRGANISAVVDQGYFSGANLLYLAAWNGDNLGGKQVIEHIAHKYPEILKAQINAAIRSGFLPLQATGTNKCIETAKFLIKLGADPNLEDSDGISSIKLLRGNKNFEVAEAIDEFYIKAILPNNNRLLIAARDGNLQEVLASLKDGANIEARDGFEDMPGYKGFTPLIVAATWGKVEIVKALLEKGASITAFVNQGYFSGANLLFLAAWNGDNLGGKQVIEYIAKNHPQALKAQINAASRAGLLPLQALGTNHCIQTAKLLVGLGANPNLNDPSGMTSIELLLRDKNNDLVEAINGYSNFRLELCDAAAKGNISEVLRLIEQGAAINCVNNDNYTPLHLATLADHVEVAKLLIEKGATINCVNNDKHTPLHLATLAGHVEAAKLLIEKGAAINLVNKDNHTPLHLATLAGHVEVAKLLIEKGAAINLVNKDNHTPLHLATLAGHVEVAKLLTAELYRKGVEKGN